VVTSGDVEIKTTLTEGTAGTNGPGYANVTASPQYLPGVVDIKFRALTIADLFPAGTTELGADPLPGGDRGHQRRRCRR
jgi:hypothetical protein